MYVVDWKFLFWSLFYIPSKEQIFTYINPHQPKLQAETYNTKKCKTNFQFYISVERR